MLPLAISGLSVRYSGLSTPVLFVDSLKLSAGEKIAVTGASGSGKSTLVNIVTGLERTRKGSVSWGDTAMETLSETQRDRWRGENIGLIMQEFHLLPGLSAMENVLLPVRLSRSMTQALGQRARFLLEKVGIGRMDQKVDTMSRGEMQRVAIARALLRRPGIIVADEPTASLDPENGATVGRLLVDLARIEGATLLVITHDMSLAQRLDRRIELANGCIVSDTLESTAK